MRDYFRYLLILTGTCLVLGSVHPVVQNWLPEAWRAEGLPGLWIFLFVLFASVQAFLWWVVHRFPDKVGFSFLGGVIVKMALCLFYLWPEIREGSRGLVIQFFPPFFLLLAQSAANMAKHLKNSE